MRCRSFLIYRLSRDFQISSYIYKHQDTSMAGYIIGFLVFVSGMAAIMSAADSILIAIAQVITTEIAYTLRPSASPHEINLVGKGVSFIMFCLVLTGVALQYIWKIPNDVTGTALTTKSGIFQSYLWTKRPLIILVLRTTVLTRPQNHSELNTISGYLIRVRTG